MQLTLWTYEGPPHVGAMRVAAAMRGVHYVLHAPQGDTYADLLFTMIERRQQRPPVTYTTFQARDLGGDTAELFKATIRDAVARFRPELLLVGASCTGELIQDDPAGLSRGLDVPVVALDLPAYQRKENWGAAETFYQIVRHCAAPAGEGTAAAPVPGAATGADGPRRPRCNILGPTALGFRHRDDLREVRGLLQGLGVAVNVVAPLGAAPADIARLGEADFNVVLYPEIADSAARWLQRTFNQPAVRTVPIGVGATNDFIAEVRRVAGLASKSAAGSASVSPPGNASIRVKDDFVALSAPACGDTGGVAATPVTEPDAAGINADAPATTPGSNLPWYSRSVDATYLTGKRVFIFADATHAIAAARVATRELGFDLAGLGTYSREQARDVRDAARSHGLDALITDDYLDVEARITELGPDLVLGTQMERHVCKRLGIPCAVISAPVHVQDFPARYSPQMGFEGANVLFDTWVHPLMMGLEEHLLAMFREDPEFAPGAAPSHLGGTRPGDVGVQTRPVEASAAYAAEAEVEAGAGLPDTADTRWEPDAEKALRRVPVFVRGKAKRNTETFARQNGLASISVQTLYDAKAHYAR